MFFYVYAVIEFLSIFLDSGIIPTSHTVYPVSPVAPSPLRGSRTPSARQSQRAPEDKRDIPSDLSCISPLRVTVVRVGARWVDLCHLLDPARQRVHRLPVRRGRNANVALGQCPRPSPFCILMLAFRSPSAATISSETRMRVLTLTLYLCPTGSADLDLCRLGCHVLRVDCDAQGVRLLLVREADRAVHRPARVPDRLRSHLRRQSAHSRHQDPRRPMGKSPLPLTLFSDHSRPAELTFSSSLSIVRSSETSCSESGSSLSAALSCLRSRSRSATRSSTTSTGSSSLRSACSSA